MQNTTTAVQNVVQPAVEPPLTETFLVAHPHTPYASLGDSLAGRMPSEVETGVGLC